jgi:hypothetical protein
VSRQKGQKVNTLTGAQKFQLWSALVELRDDFERGSTSKVEAAKILTQKLGFQVSISAVATAVRQGIVAWKEGRGPNSYKRLVDLEKRVSELEDLTLKLLTDLGQRNGKAEDKDPVKEVDTKKAWVGK